MQRFFDVVQNRQGTALVGASITVYDGSGNLATLYSTNFSVTGIGPTSNPVFTNSDGEYAFYAANGTYSLVISYNNYTSETRVGVILFDPADGSLFAGSLPVRSSSGAAYLVPLTPA